jgi:hypothetical protein
MCFIIHKTTSELEHAIFTTLYFASSENTDRRYFLSNQEGNSPTNFIY